MYRSVKMFILHQMFDIILLLMFFESANANECPIDKTCDSFWKHLLKYPGHNLKKALKCLEYNENISPMEALGNKSVPQEIFYGNMGRQYAFKRGVQNWKDFCQKIKIQKGNY